MDYYLGNNVCNLYRPLKEKLLQNLIRFSDIRTFVFLWSRLGNFSRELLLPISTNDSHPWLIVSPSRSSILMMIAKNWYCIPLERSQVRVLFTILLNFVLLKKEFFFLMKKQKLIKTSCACITSLTIMVLLFVIFIYIFLICNNFCLFKNWLKTTLWNVSCLSFTNLFGYIFK